MISAPPRTMLARLRSSARLAMLVLLVFALKISAAAACVTHDFADLGLGTGADSSHVAIIKASPTASNDVGLSKTPLGQASTCQHCGCHHAVAVFAVAYISLAIVTNELTVHTSGVPPSAASLLELRPPIV